MNTQTMTSGKAMTLVTGIGRAPLNRQQAEHVSRLRHVDDGEQQSQN